MADGSIIAATCPRCAIKNITLDVMAATASTKAADYFECFLRCRGCHQTSIFVLYDRSGSLPPTSKDLHGSLINYRFTATVLPPIFPDAIECPEFVPTEESVIFAEAALCMAVSAWDAAGAMFRKVLDRVTRGLIPIEFQSDDKNSDNYISYKVRKDLRLRLDWLFDRELLPKGLKELVSAVHQDGNDAAHSAESIGMESALDLQDFTIAILEELFTTPGRIAANIARRNERRGAS